MVDGFGGGWDKTHILAIMKDSRIGSYGAVALVMLLLAKFCALVEIDLLLIPLTLIAGHALLAPVRDDRCCARSTTCATRARPSRWPPRIGRGALAFAALTALLPLLLLPPRQVDPGRRSRPARHALAGAHVQDARSAATPAIASAPRSSFPKSPSTAGCCAGFPDPSSAPADRGRHLLRPARRRLRRSAAGRGAHPAAAAARHAGHLQPPAPRPAAGRGARSRTPASTPG